MTQRNEFEMALRVRRVEQQMDALPASWKQFSGKPMHMSHYGTTINTFRDNPELQPTRAFMQSALQELKQQLIVWVDHAILDYFRVAAGRFADTALLCIRTAHRENVRLSDAEMEEIIRQEWQTDMTRSVLEARLNRHQSKDGPVMRRSANGVVYAAAQPAPGAPFVLDAIATPPRRKR